MTSLLITPVDVEAQTKGAWADYHGVQLKIARSNNPDFKKLMVELAEQNESALNSTAEVKEKASVELLSKAMSKTLLLDWTDHPSGAEYSTETAESLLLQDEDCRTFVLTFANEISNFYTSRVRKTAEK